MKKIKAAMVGVANFGKVRRELLRESGLYELVGSYDFNVSAMEEARKEDGAVPCSSYEALLQLPGLETVIISTGAKDHAAQAIAAMEKGKHVYIEKPLCSTPDELAALYAAQHKSGLVVGVGHEHLHQNALCMVIKEYIDIDKLGKLAAVECNSSHCGGLTGDPTNWRFDPEKNPGGMLFQCGVHALHEMMHILGPITEVSAFMRDDVHVTRTVDVAQTLLRFESGLIGNLNCYHVTPYEHCFRLYGTKGILHVTTSGKIIYQGLFHKEEYVEVPLPILSEEVQKANRLGGVVSFAQAVRGEISTVYPGLDEGARSVAVVFACDKSAKSGRKESVKVRQ